MHLTGFPVCISTKEGENYFSVREGKIIPLTLVILGGGKGAKPAQKLVKSACDRVME